MLRHWLLSAFMFIGTLTATAIGQDNWDNEPSVKVGDIIEVEMVYAEPPGYTYDQRLVELKPATPTEESKKATKEPKKDSRKTNQTNESESCPEYEGLFKQYGLKPVKTFSYIAWRESRCRPNAVNAKWDDKGNITWTLNKDGSIDRGLLQVNSTWKTVTSNACGSAYGNMDVLYNLDCNLKVAKYLLDNGGLGHWGM